MKCVIVQMSVFESRMEECANVPRTSVVCEWSNISDD